jgi:hypothetical protein
VIQRDAEGGIRGIRSGSGCRIAGETFAVTAFVAGDLVGFTVCFDEYDSLTSWTGHCGLECGEETIEALWHMAVRMRGDACAPGLWQGLWSGSEVFVRHPSPRQGETRSHPTILRSAGGVV